MKLRKVGNRFGRGLVSLLVVACLAFGAEASGVTNVTINSVSQRWPWNNKVDISYSVEGGQTRAAGVYCGLRFTLTAGGKTYDIPGYSIGASAENGDHTVTWTAPKGIVAADCSMTATLFTTNVPSGNDYMIINLNTGDVVFEGAYATQDESNSRYNVNTYKLYSMVLRKVPKWADKDVLPNAEFLSSLSGYRTGDSVNYSSSNYSGNWFINTDKYWVTDRAYYISIFPVTQRQYETVGADKDSTPAMRREGSYRDYRPVEGVSWNDLRGTIAPTSSIPAVAVADSGTFFQRLNFKTGNKYSFDLPTEVMFEIAERAGTTTQYFWGDSDADILDYAIISDNAYNGSDTKTNPVKVGSCLPNAWGLYDTAGNVREWCRDDTLNGSSAGTDLTARIDAFTPVVVENSTSKRVRGGGNWSNGKREWCRSSYRFTDASDKDKAHENNYIGFRVSMIAD